MDNNLKPEKKQDLGYRHRDFKTYAQPSDRIEWPVFKEHSGHDSPDDFYKALVEIDKVKVSKPLYNWMPYWIRRPPEEYGQMTEKQRNTKSIMGC